MINLEIKTKEEARLGIVLLTAYLNFDEVVNKTKEVKETPKTIEVKETPKTKEVKETLPVKGVSMVDIKGVCKKLAKKYDGDVVRGIINDVTGSNILANADEADYDRLLVTLQKKLDEPESNEEIEDEKIPNEATDEEIEDDIRKLCNNFVVGDGTSSPETKKENRAKINKVIKRFSTTSKLSGVSSDNQSELLNALKEL